MCWRRTVVACLAAALGLVGCGEDSEDAPKADDPAKPPTTKAPATPKTISLDIDTTVALGTTQASLSGTVAPTDATVDVARGDGRPQSGSCSKGDLPGGRRDNPDLPDRSPHGRWNCLVSLEAGGGEAVLRASKPGYPDAVKTSSIRVTRHAPSR